MQRRVIPAVVLLVGNLLVSGRSEAQPGLVPAPCCVIVSIDATTGVASAKVSVNGTVFQFRANSPATLSPRLSTGQTVYANFRNGQVSVDGRRVCCQIVTEAAVASPSVTAAAGAAPGASELTAAPTAADDNTACCVVTGVDMRAGVISAKDPKTGYTFKFTVIHGKLSAQDSATLVRLATIGQKVWADFHYKGVKLDQSTLCCVIIELYDH